MVFAKSNFYFFLNVESERKRDRQTQRERKQEPETKSLRICFDPLRFVRKVFFVFFSLKIVGT